MTLDVGDGRLRADRERQQELRERAIVEAHRSSTPLEVAVIFSVAFAIPAAAAWGLIGFGIAALLGGVMWLFERRRQRAQAREGLVRLWRAIQEARCLDDAREAARQALADLGVAVGPAAPGR